MIKTKIQIVGAALATLAACAPVAQVHHVNPSLGAPYGTLPHLQHAERAIADAENIKQRDPRKGMGLYLSGVESATTELRKNPKDRIALRDYNFALSRVFSVIRVVRFFRLSSKGPCGRGPGRARVMGELILKPSGIVCQ